VVLGAHGSRQGQHFKYTRSVHPNSTAEFTDPEPFPSGYTYPALLCDRNDKLHLVARAHGIPYKLVYLSREPGQPWGAQRDLIVPYTEGAAFYAIWYHKLNMDRRGRLFLNYWYYGLIGCEEQAAARRAKWPDDKFRALPEGGWEYEEMHPHDPAMLMSDDGGETWRLALTEDFVAGVASQTP